MTRDEQHEYKRVNRMECSASPDDEDDNIELLSEGGFSDNIQPKRAPQKIERNEDLLNTEELK